AGMFGILVNQSALEAADAARLSDSRALALHDGALVRQSQVDFATELADFLDEHTIELGKNNSADRRELSTLVAESPTFRYAALVTDPSGAVLTATRESGLPPAADTGWAPLHKLVTAGQSGYSSVMRVNGTYVQAVAVPIKVDDDPAGALVGLTEVAGTALQKHVESLKDDTHTTMVVDADGTIGTTDHPAEMGTPADPAIRSALAGTGSFRFLEYTTAGGIDMIAAMVGLPGGSAYVRTQTLRSFDGAVRDQTRTLNLALVAMLLIGVAAIVTLGLRATPDRNQGRHRGLV
ncbi:MAG TPA: sensor domain-containing diguanylate cyclase, partial [Actinoplanes sp.]